MRAGAYNHNIEILRKAVVTNDYGTDVITWETLKKTKAKIDWIAGAKTEENNEVFFSEQVSFTIRRYNPIQHEDRIKWKDNQYRILSIHDEDDTTHNDKIILTELINE